jgi:hypothetical protein
MSHQSRFLGLLALLFVCAIPLQAQQARWVSTYSWQGKGNQQTPIFFVTADKWRLVYHPKGKGPFGIVLNRESGHDPVVVTNQKGTVVYAGRRAYTKGGRRYLAITAPQAEWDISVEQYLTPIQEWHLVQLSKKETPQLARLATWTGETGDDEFEIRIPRGSWKLFTHVEGEGKLNVAVSPLAEDGETLELQDLTAGDGGSWVHQSGSFRVRTRATPNCAWKLDVCIVK